MSLNGIDTASYQTGLDPAKVPMDFNIVKATQGTTYVNPDFSRMASATVKAGKLLGIYHYAAGGGPMEEADFFLSKISGYIGKALLALDWEGMQNPAFGKSDVKWCKAFMDRVREKTGVTCLIYMSKSVCRTHDWTSVAKDYPLWCAQYAGNGATGYLGDPWTDGNGFGTWTEPVIYQYSSNGKLPGWNGRLDLDIAYITPDQWQACAAGKKAEKHQVLFPDLTDTDLAVEVLFDVHGSGEARRKALGNRYSPVQGTVEELWGNFSSFISATRSYIKAHGADALVK